MSENDLQLGENVGNIMFAKDIINNFNPYISRYYGNVEDTYAESFQSLSSATNTSIIWISSRHKNINTLLLETNYAIAICPDSYTPSDDLIKRGRCFIITPNPRLLAIKVAQFYFAQVDCPSIHPTAIIHPQAVIGRYCKIGEMDSHHGF